MKTLIEILKEQFIYRKQIWKLAVSDLVKTYSGAALGWAWAVISPAVTLFVYWFAFSVGMRGGRDVDGYPYFLWLTTGMVPWFYVRSMLTGGASSLRRYTYLITKIKYPISTIPTFVNLSSFFVHLVLMAIVVALYLAFGYMPDLYWLQLPFYMVLGFVFFNIWGLFAGILSSFSRDFLNLVRSLTTALLWMSGILYSVNTINTDWIRFVMLLNPITVIINGYRNCFIYKQWFWEVPNELFNYVLVTSVLCVLAVWAYKKLRKDIPDVL